MHKVDEEEATRRARGKADRAIELLYRKEAVNTPEAHRTWSRTFWREYFALTSPTTQGEGE